MRTGAVRRGVAGGVVLTGVLALAVLTAFFPSDWGEPPLRLAGPTELAEPQAASDELDELGWQADEAASIDEVAESSSSQPVQLWMLLAPVRSIWVGATLLWVLVLAAVLLSDQRDLSAPRRERLGRDARRVVVSYEARYLRQRERDDSPGGGPEGRLSA